MRGGLGFSGWMTSNKRVGSYFLSVRGEDDVNQVI